MLKNKNTIYFIIKSFLFAYLLKDIKLTLFKLFRLNIYYTKYSLIFIPIKIKKFSVVRSPTMSKLSKEQFETRQYKVCIAFATLNKTSFFLIKKALTNLNLKQSYSLLKTYNVH